MIKSRHTGWSVPPYLLVILSGVLYALPFSFPHLFYLSWFALVPFLYAIEGDSPADGFLKGLILGLVVSFFMYFWLYFPLVDFSGLPWIFCLLLLLILFILPALFYGLWSWLFLLPGKNKMESAFWLAVSWTGVEYLRYRLLTGLPLGFTGYTQAGFTQLLQLADIGGMFLIGFIVILLNGYLFKFTRNLHWRRLIPLMVLIGIVLITGGMKYNHYQQKEYQSLDVGIVRTDLSASEKWKVVNIEPNINNLLEKTRHLQDADLVIWPESSLTFDLIRNGYYRQKFFNSFQDIDTYVQAGSLAVVDNSYQQYNSSFLLSPGGSIKERYNKIRLVPFGEYIPFAGLIESLTGYTLSSEAAGREIVYFQTPSARWRTAICSEILYPELVQQGISRAQFLVNQSNEAWYRHGNLQQQMWSAAVFRAVENRRSVSKAGNMAYSGIIAPSGAVIVKRVTSQPGPVRGQVLLSTEDTVYQRWGDFAGYLSLGIIFLLLLIRGLRLLYSTLSTSSREGST